MKYFTKEWYELCGKTDLHLCLVEDKEAESFSEEYYQKLYNQKLEEYLLLEERVASRSLEDIKTVELSTLISIEDISDEEIAVEVVSHKKQLETAKDRCISQKPFNREEASKQFQERFALLQEHVQKSLPNEILEKIADIRVFALDRASREVIDDVTRFCDDNEKEMMRILEEYREYYKNALESFDKSVVEKINFHDCTIIGIEQTEAFLTIRFDNTKGFTDINEIRFENYRIVKQEGILKNSCWLYNEIYKVDGKLELHVLLLNRSMELLELIVCAENISFKTT